MGSVDKGIRNNNKALSCHCVREKVRLEHGIAESLASTRGKTIAVLNHRNNSVATLRAKASGVIRLTDHTRAAPGGIEIRRHQKARGGWFKAVQKGFFCFFQGGKEGRRR